MRVLAICDKSKQAFLQELVPSGGWTREVHKSWNGELYGYICNWLNPSPEDVDVMGEHCSLYNLDEMTVEQAFKEHSPDLKYNVTQLPN